MVKTFNRHDYTETNARGFSCTSVTERAIYGSDLLFTNVGQHFSRTFKHCSRSSHSQIRACDWGPGSQADKREVDNKCQNPSIFGLVSTSLV